MNGTRVWTLLAVCLVAVLAFGCSQEGDGTAKKVGDAMGDATSSVADAADDMADSVADTMEDAKAEAQKLIAEKKDEIAELTKKLEGASATGASELKGQLDKAKSELADLEKKLSDMM